MRDIFISCLNKNQAKSASRRKHRMRKKFYMKSCSMTYRDRVREKTNEADDISNLWQISIHNISSLFRKERTQENFKPYRNKQFMNCKKKRDEERRNAAMHYKALAWDARRLIVKSGSLQKKTKNWDEQLNDHSFFSRSQQVFLMHFWSIYLIDFQQSVEWERRQKKEIGLDTDGKIAK